MATKDNTKQTEENTLENETQDDTQQPENDTQQHEDAAVQESDTQKEPANEESWSEDTWSDPLENESKQELIETIHKLERKLDEQQTIAKRAQSDYFQLKMDMDSLVSRTTKQQSTATVDSMVKVWKKIFPMITQLKQTVDWLSDEIKETQWGSGVVLVLKKMMHSLESLNIYPIETQQWNDPDINKHIPISTEPTDNKKLKWKILKQVEQWYYYNDETTEKVIIPAKVIVWV